MLACLDLRGGNAIGQEARRALQQSLDRSGSSLLVRWGHFEGGTITGDETDPSPSKSSSAVVAAAQHASASADNSTIAAVLHSVPQKVKKSDYTVNIFFFSRLLH